MFCVSDQKEGTSGKKGADLRPTGVWLEKRPHPSRLLAAGLGVQDDAETLSSLSAWCEIAGIGNEQELRQWVSKYSPWTNSSNISWRLVKNANSCLLVITDPLNPNLRYRVPQSIVSQSIQVSWIYWEGYFLSIHLYLSLLTHSSIYPIIYSHI